MARLRVRARAVDMLGRQQIAGIPTAIHELFKNSHDAYADRVEVDFFRADQLVIIRDDGYGMTKEDFETRWLTLGTESKIGQNRPDKEVAFPNRPLLRNRPIMGEKGIGRLAIAAIGPQVLVTTRAARKNRSCPLVVSLIHWGLFEMPGIDLDQIEIPVEELPNDHLPDRAVTKRLADRIRANLKSLRAAVSTSDQNRILADLDLADFDVMRVQNRLKGMTLENGGYGTHFYIRPNSPLLIDDIERRDSYGASPLEQILLGFSNTMMPTGERPSIIAEFRDHREDGTIDELIGTNSFFTPPEFESADHHVDGTFDEFGQFLGTVSVYHESPQQHQIRWPGAIGQSTECGPFRIRFAYVQGNWRDSRLPADLWAELTAKLDRIGGLYIYRDGIRILPYGRADYDFLHIERRRTKSAQDWYFSYRRLFGAVEITQGENPGLVEKAGREGFRTNSAYRQFQSILENFFERLAIDFFRPTSEYGDGYQSYKEQLNRERDLLKKREKATRARKREFSDQLSLFFDRLEKQAPTREATRIKQSVQSRLAAIATLDDPHRATRELLELEKDVQADLALLEGRNTVTKPRGVGLSRALKADWSAYMTNFEKVRKDIITPLRQEIDDMITSVAKSSPIGLDRHRRVVSALSSKRDAATADTNRARREVERAVRELQEGTDEAIRFVVTRATNDTEQIFIEIERTDLSAVPDRKARQLQVAWEERLDSIGKDAVAAFNALRDQLDSMAKAVQDRESADDTIAAIESSAQEYREQLDQYVELAQVGMALGIVQHEFGAAIKQIRSAIRKLRPWADGTPGLRDIHGSLLTNFSHLDAYLKLFTPLSRRLNREAIDLTGEEIRHYLDEVFHDRLARHSIDMRATAAFDQTRLHGFPSTFLPAFVNIVDNAIYWITTDRASQRFIELDAEGDTLRIRNGGPGIERRIADRIFSFGETTKLGGRGMGLFLSREVLRHDGYDLILREAGTNTEPAFEIRPLSPVETTGANGRP